MNSISAINGHIELTDKGIEIIKGVRNIAKSSKLSGKPELLPYHDISEIEIS